MVVANALAPVASRSGGEIGGGRLTQAPGPQLPLVQVTVSTGGWASVWKTTQ